MHILGIDLGLQGALTVLDVNRKVVECVSIPTNKVQVGSKMRTRYDVVATNQLIKGLNSKYQITKAGMERLRAMPQQSSLASFSLGGGTMLFKTLLTVYEIPYVEFEPRMWQRKIFGDQGIQYTGKTTKEASVQAARQLWPGEQFLLTERAKVPSHDMTDSACIALYTLQQE